MEKKPWYKITEEDIQASVDKWFNEAPLEEIVEFYKPLPENRAEVTKNILFRRHFRGEHMKYQASLRAKVIAHLMYGAIENERDILLSVPRQHGKTTAIEELKKMVFNEYCIAVIDFKDYARVNYRRTAFHGLVIDEASNIPNSNLNRILDDMEGSTLILISTPKRGSLFNEIFLNDVDFKAFERISFRGNENEELRKELPLDVYREEVLGEILG